MPDQTLTAAIDRIRTLLAKVLPPGHLPAQLEPAAPLIDAGVSSLDMVNLMLAIEADFDLFIPPEQVNPQNFRSLETIAVMVCGLIGRRRLRPRERRTAAGPRCGPSCSGARRPLPSDPRRGRDGPR